MRDPKIESPFAYASTTRSLLLQFEKNGALTKRMTSEEFFGMSTCMSFTNRPSCN